MKRLLLLFTLCCASMAHPMEQANKEALAKAKASLKGDYAHAAALGAYAGHIVIGTTLLGIVAAPIAAPALLIGAGVGVGCNYAYNKYIDQVFDNQKGN